MNDLIDRQAAIDALAQTAREKFNLSDEFNHYLAGLMDGENAIRQLPSAQPEIIRCCKCVYWQQNTVRQNSNDAGWWNEALCEKHTIDGNEPHEAWVDADWYCADAERRTDEADYRKE